MRGEDSDPLVGHQNGMFVLRRQFTVCRGSCPAVRFVDDGLGYPQVNHRLDGEDHAGTEPGAVVAHRHVIRHLRFLVELNADAVPAELMHNATALRHGVLVNFKTDVAQMLAWADVGDADIHALLSHRHDFIRVFRHFTNGVHIGRIAVVTAKNGGHVDVDNIPILDNLLAGDAVADYLVDGDAGGFREAVITLGGGDRAVVVDEFFNLQIEFRCRHAGPHKWFDIFQTPAGQYATPLNADNLPWRLDNDAHACIIMDQHLKPPYLKKPGGCSARRAPGHAI